MPKVPVVARLRLPDGREFDVHSEAEPDAKQYPGESPFSGTLYYWTEGNNGCDCNRELYIEREYDIDLRPDGEDYHCGDTIELLSLSINGEDVLATRGRNKC